MIIKTSQIPTQGLEISFELDKTVLNQRVAQETDNSASSKSARELKYNYSFRCDPKVNILVTIEGTTVFLRGNVKSEFSALCGRCAEDVSRELRVNIDLMLKRVSEETEIGQRRESDAIADLNVDYYAGDEFDCEPIVEELLVLALPFVVVCKDECKGLCSSCGANLNLGQCNCKTDQNTDNPFRAIKLNK
ncbi:MAG: DUF177 domain-containing protein [Deltaproteobacteria bacterium]|nr:DUF177 domain-containing protein [Deltaproteobacteria bacterium]